MTETYRLPWQAYDILINEAMGDASALSAESREALRTAAHLPDGVWVVDCSERASRDIEEWFKQAAAVEAFTPKGDAGRLKILTGALRTIRDGRVKSRRE